MTGDKHWIDVTITEQNLRTHNTLESGVIRIEEKAAIIQGGSQSAPSDIGSAYQRHTHSPLRRVLLNDSRGHQLLICQLKKKYYAIPAPDFFSRYSGTCLMLGDKCRDPIPHTLAVGDMLHLGSVGLIVTEMHTGQLENGLKVISRSQLEHLLEEELQIYCEISDDENIESLATVLHQNDNNLPPQCYICLDSETTDDNPLISACQCCGDTSTVHLNCVRKWHSIVIEDKSCIITNANEKNEPYCTVCKTVYKSSFQMVNGGKKQKIFQKQVHPPYITFIVVTRHDSAEHLFNTRFQLSFANELKKSNLPPKLYIGRSTECDLILDYRTVSGWHGFVQFQNGSFIYEDLKSSNGTLVYIQKPIELPLNHPRTFRLGRTLVSLQHQCSVSTLELHQQENDESLEADIHFFHELCKWPQRNIFSPCEDIKKSFHEDFPPLQHVKELSFHRKRQNKVLIPPESNSHIPDHKHNNNNNNPTSFFHFAYHQPASQQYSIFNYFKNDIDHGKEDEEVGNSNNRYINSKKNFVIQAMVEPKEIKSQPEDLTNQVSLRDINEDKTKSNNIMN